MPNNIDLNLILLIESLVIFYTRIDRLKKGRFCVTKSHRSLSNTTRVDFNIYNLLAIRRVKAFASILLSPKKGILLYHYSGGRMPDNLKVPLIGSIKTYQNEKSSTSHPVNNIMYFTAISNSLCRY